jgi:hypothetical protein
VKSELDRERERVKSGRGVVGDTTITGGEGGTENISAYEGSQPVPTRPTGIDTSEGG